jgi:DsbC/DsbD-like thiol-disulfide interchange protein
VNIPLEEPSTQQPVVAGAALSPTRVRPGDTLVLTVQVKLAPTWHLYAPEGRHGSGMPVSLKAQLPAGVETAGDWVYPKAAVNLKDQSRVYEDAVIFRYALKVAADARPGPLRVTCEFGYQVCDPFSCRPPTTEKLEASAEVVP